MVAFDCREYLETVLPALILRTDAPRLERSVVLQFVVTDRPGCDRYYELSDEGLKVGEGISDRVDLTVGICAEDLASLSRNALDVPRALGTRRLKVMGDDSLLLWLSARLAAQPAS
jgi:hypothetical protein